MGNTTVWKPATTSLLSSYVLMQVFMEAGLPPGVINFVPGPGRVLSGVVLEHPCSRACTSPARTPRSTGCGRRLPANLPKYRSYPRIVGETGGKGFVFVHPSSDPRRRGDGAGARRLRVPGPEVLGRLARLHPGVDVAGGEAAHGRHARPREDGRRARLQELRERGDRRCVVHEHHELHRAREGVGRRRDRVRRPRRQVEGLLHRADRRQDHQPEVPHDGGGDFRAGAHDLRLRGREAGKRRCTCATRRRPTR